RGDRPSLRTADDRRRANAARPLRAGGRHRDRHRVHTLGGAARPPLRDASVRRADRAAGAARTRHRDGGGGGLARSVASRRLPADHRPERAPGDPLRRRARLRAGGRRVRLGRPDLGQPALQDRGLVRVHHRADPERRHARRRGALGAPPRDLVRRAARDRRRPPLRNAFRPRPGGESVLPAAWAGGVTGRLSLRLAALCYLLAVLLAPVGLVFYRTFEHGLHPVSVAVSQRDAVHALWLTVLIALVTVPLNTVFGVLGALAIVRHRFPGVGVVNAVVDLPLALSPVVVGLALFLLYGRGWLGDFFINHGIRVLFALPSMMLATI